MVGLGTIYTLAGVILVEHIVEKAAETKGHGDKVPWIKLVGYLVCMGIALRAFQQAIHYVSGVFHVY